MGESTENPIWRKSGRCGNAACVEVAKVGDRYLVRNSTDPVAQPLEFSADEWSAFVNGVRAGDFD